MWTEEKNTTENKRKTVSKGLDHVCVRVWCVTSCVCLKELGVHVSMLRKMLADQQEKTTKEEKSRARERDRERERGERAFVRERRDYNIGALSEKREIIES